MAGEGNSDSTEDAGIDLYDAGSHRWTLLTRRQGNSHLPEIVTITHEHQKVHEGEFYSAGYLDEAVINDGTIEILLQTPADKTMHSYIKLIAGGDARFDVYEGTTFSAAGTAISPVNHNRSSANTCGCTVTHTPTITTDGTLIWSEYIAGGSGGLTPGAVQNVSTEQAVFDSNAVYLFRLTNLAGTAQPLQIISAYYPVAA